MTRAAFVSRIGFIFISIIVFVLLAVAFLWAYTRQTPQYIAFSTDLRSQDSFQNYLAGRQSFGLYAAQGRIGFLYHTEQLDQLDSSNISLYPPQPARFIWEHSDNPDSNFMGGISFDELSYHVTFSHFGLWLYDGNETGMGQTQTFEGGLLDTWLVISFLLVIVGLTIWRARRRRRALEVGVCPICSYDIRIQIQGHAGHRCPECGTPIPVPTGK